MRTLLRWLLRLLYDFRVFNESVLNTPGPVLLLPNHVSWWDWLLLGVCLEDDWRFVTSQSTAQVSWIHRLVMINRRTFPVDVNSPYAVKHVAEYLQHGGRIVLFPEGRLSSTGSLMKLFDGTGFLIFKTHAKVLTAYLRGAHRLPFSRNPNRKKWFPKLSLHISDVLTPPKLPHMSVTEERFHLTDWLRDEMVKQQFQVEMECGAKTLPEAILEAAREQPGQVIVEDIGLNKLTYRRLFIGADVLGAQWLERFGPESERVGVLLPNMAVMPVVLLSLWSANKVPAILNYTTGPAALLASARIAGLKHLITSKAFVQRAELDLAPLAAGGVQFHFLEEIRGHIRPGQRAWAALRQFPRPRLPARPLPSAANAAVILFTSGSEGIPKGVELTHTNLLSNIRQMLSVIDIMDTDRLFNALPLFHSYGLNAGLFLPLVRRVFVFLYVSPLHYRVVPSALYHLDCTIFFGTNTFLMGYARKAHPYDFRAVRYVLAGAEKLQESTSQVWMRKFGVRVLEGYGVTECSPVLSINLPTHPRPGSAGRFLPGIEYRLEPVEGISAANGKPTASAPPVEGTAGRLFVRGPNIMRGYLNPEANAAFQSLNGWYDTGDIARVDADGFVFIMGRLKRFAKISGEMVSLTAVEEVLAGAFPQYGLKFAVAIAARPDEAKGEKLIAVTNEPKLTLAEVRAAVQAGGLGNLAAPRELRVMNNLPRLSTGKVNHRELEAML